MWFQCFKQRGAHLDIDLTCKLRLGKPADALKWRATERGLDVESKLRRVSKCGVNFSGECVVIEVKVMASSL